MNVYDYLRVSGSSQVERDGFVRQREAISRFRDKHNLVCLGEFSEKGVSGTVDGMDRPTFADMLQKAEALADFKIEAIVVENMDRLARDLMVSEFLLRECRDRNLKVFCADQGVLIDMAQSDADPTRILMRQILGALSQWEKSKLVAKLRSAKQRNRVLKAGWTEGKKPYGHHPGEGDILKAMKEYREKGFSYEDIAIELNAAGHFTRHGKRWSNDTVNSVLNRKRIKCVVRISNI